MNQEDSLAVLRHKNIHDDMVHSSGLRGYLDLMQQLGIDPMPLLEKYGIQLGQLQDDNAWISHAAMIQLLEDSAQQPHCPDFGLRISQYQDIGILGVLGLILQSASTLREVIKYSSDLLFLHGSALRLYINEAIAADLFEPHADIVAIVFDIQLNDSTPILSKRQSMDLGLAVCHRVMRYLSGEQYQPLKVTLPHSPIAPLSTYKRFFHTDVLENQQHAALFLHKDMLNITLASIDHGLREIVDSYLERSFRSHQGSLSDRVQHAIRIHLSGPKANKTDIACMLAMHPRSLQRKLDEEGTSFEQIRDKLRQQLLLQYLADSKASMSQIASVLGFSEQSALSRACKNWFGVAPRQLKKLRNQDQ
ncbi:AraC family transcriptional regulator [Acinetobacter sp. WCHAc060042]|uniref:AraC family transcriptional regulator n=1 Tax=Acinetobacter sp. WCHAc060042 TaxID=2213016 RepID=UPI000DA67D13|nr:AraC family transcriptional regulator [Acinetobacter sp. WCHAc060042]